MAIHLGQSTKSRSRRRLCSEINVTPFVDVMLVLLVIFMVTSPMLISGIEVDLPKATTAPLSGQDEPIVVSIDKEGAVYIQEMKLSNYATLGVKLKAILGVKKDTRIFVRGDQYAAYGMVIKLFATIKEAGFYNVALLTEQNDEHVGSRKRKNKKGDK